MRYSWGIFYLTWIFPVIFCAFTSIPLDLRGKCCIYFARCNYFKALVSSYFLDIVFINTKHKLPTSAHIQIGPFENSQSTMHHNRSRCNVKTCSIAVLQSSTGFLTDTGCNLIHVSPSTRDTHYKRCVFLSVTIHLITAPLFWACHCICEHFVLFLLDFTQTTDSSTR